MRRLVQKRLGREQLFEVLQLPLVRIERAAGQMGAGGTGGVGRGIGEIHPAGVLELRSDSHVQQPALPGGLHVGNPANVGDLAGFGIHHRQHAGGLGHHHLASGQEVEPPWLCKPLGYGLHDRIGLSGLDILTVRGRSRRCGTVGRAAGVVQHQRTRRTCGDHRPQADVALLTHG
jgi:hypothetical protein